MKLIGNKKRQNESREDVEDKNKMKKHKDIRFVVYLQIPSYDKFGNIST